MHGHVGDLAGYVGRVMHAYSSYAAVNSALFHGLLSVQYMASIDSILCTEVEASLQDTGQSPHTTPYSVLTE